MKKTLAFFAMCLLAVTSFAADYAPKVDKSTQERIIITTDLEVDDMNGLLMSLMYSDHYDLAGIVWTAGMFHFSGDGGEHTLAEITPNYRCSATHCEHIVDNAGELTYYRPADPSWLGRVMEYYEEDYKLLSKNNPNYPTPEYLRSITKVGNIQFEGDYRFETEGSKLIEKCIMDDDPRPLYIQHWGGINTTVRALYSIYEKYHGTADWDAVLAKVVGKVRLGGSGEDNCRKDSKIDEMFPGLQDGGYGMGRGFFSYGTFFSASDSRMAAAPELQKYLHADFILDAYKFNHGKVLGEVWLMDEGRAIFGEPYCYNYGIIDYIDWGAASDLGWGPEDVKSFPRANYKRYDWMCCQFGCASYINIGLRPDVRNQNNHYTSVMWEELAARADWAVFEPEDCNHAPIVTADVLDVTVKKGKSVVLNGTAIDPDGDALNVKWYVPANACTYQEGKAEGLAVSNATDSSAEFTVPKDAKSGDKFVVNMEVQDDAERPMTRFAQYVITVK